MHSKKTLIFTNGFKLNLHKYFSNFMILHYIYITILYFDGVLPHFSPRYTEPYLNKPSS